MGAPSPPTNWSSRTSPPGRRPVKGKELAGPRRVQSRPRSSAKDRALILLGVRWRSREELRRRLLQAGFEPEEIEATLVDLERVGLVEDGRFAREVVRDQAQRRMSGERAIRAALRQRGVGDAVIQEALRDAGDEAERARELARRRVQRMSNLGPEAAYRRLFSLLVRRGYGSGVAREVCREAVDAAFPGRIPEEDA